MPDEQQPEEQHLRPDGLDLAREITRATVQSSASQPARRPSRGPSSDRARRRRTGSSKPSGAHPDDRDPQTLDSTLGRLVADRGWSVDLAVQGVFGRWADIVGEQVAAHTTPESYDDTRLVVRTDSTAWATQLRLLAPTIIVRLNEELGDGTVSHIDIQGPHVPSWTRGRRTVKGRGPRDTYG